MAKRLEPKLQLLVKNMVSEVYGKVSAVHDCLSSDEDTFEHVPVTRSAWEKSREEAKRLGCYLSK